MESEDMRMRTTILRATLGTAPLALLAIACETPPEGRAPAPWTFGQGELPADEPEPVAVQPGMSKTDVAELAAIGAAAWSEDVCELSTNEAGENWYEDDECDWYCPHPDPQCDVGAIGPDPVGDAAQYPIVLVHGFMDKGGAFVGLEDVLRGDGHKVERVSLPPIAPVAVRAEALAEQVDAILAAHGAAKVNLIGHSMGGLDSRYLVHHLGYADKVASVTTIATPHRGSAVADTVLGWTDTENKWVDWLMDKLVVVLESQFEGGDDEDLIGALEDLSVEKTADFNAETPDAAGVFYQSWAGVSSPIAKWPADVEAQCGDVLAAEPYYFGFGADRMALMLVPLSSVAGGINDGVVSLHSAQWGRSRGCIPADHLDQVKDAGGPLWITGYDSARFLRNIAFELAKRGY